MMGVGACPPSAPMSADHQHNDSSANLKIAFFLNLGFTLIEIAGGFWTNSIAILTDAVHDLGDCVSLGLAWWFDRISYRAETPVHTFGYRRYRLLGGVITGVALLVGLGFVLFHSIGRLLEPEPVYAPGMIGLAVLGILFNGAAVLRVRRGTSLTERMVSWHLLEDTLGWVVVLLGAGAMAIWDLPMIDPLLSIALAVVVLWNAFRNLKKLITVFLQVIPDGFDPATFRAEAKTVEGVESVHHLHAWSIDGESHVLSAHVVRSGEPGEDWRIREKIVAMLTPRGFDHITLQFESAIDPCPEREGLASGEASGSA